MMINKLITIIKEIEAKQECKEIKITDKHLEQVDSLKGMSSFNLNRTCKTLEKQRCKNKWQ